jgi:hypothetical protein
VVDGKLAFYKYLHVQVKHGTTSYSILPALSLDGIIDVVVLEGAINAEIFEIFVDGLTLEMSPYPAKNSVLVLDNVKFHHSERVREILETK